MAKWNGSSWSPLGSGVSDSVLAIAVSSTGDVYAGGAFTTAGGSTVNRIAKWDGTSWSPLGSGMNSTVDAITMNSTTGDLYAGGAFTTAGGVSTNYIARWNGTSWSPLGSGMSNYVYAITENSTGDVYVGGNFTSAGGKPSDYFGIWHNPLASCSTQFSDVQSGSTFYPFGHCLACLGIVSGYSDGTFRPNNPVTRGQLSKVVSNSAGFSDTQTTQMFEDVPVGSTFFDFIGRLASRGYIGGYPCGGPGEPCGAGNLPYFRPNANASRAQITKIDSNAAGYTDNPSGQQFEDIPVGSTYYTYTYRLVTRSIMSGYPCGGPGEPCGSGNLPYFRPNNNATRGQTSKIVSNTYFPSCSPSLKQLR